MIAAVTLSPDLSRASVGEGEATVAGATRVPHTAISPQLIGPARASRRSVLIGSRLGPYEIITLIGAGGMGEVYRARDPRLDRDVAIKVLPTQFVSDPDRLRRFEDEARTIAALSHPNVLTIYDVGSHEGAPYIVSELLDGETLRRRLMAGPLSPHKTCEYAIQIAQGLAAAHQRGIVHRDIKPENLFITRDGLIKILDFGVAKLAQRLPLRTCSVSVPTTSEATKPGVVIGTAGYMSPEQVRGVPVDHRTDLFSLGCVLFEMLSGRAPFQRETGVDSMSAILHDDPPLLTCSGRVIPAAYQVIVRRCLEKRPDDRFSSAHDVALAMQAVSTAPHAAIPEQPDSACSDASLSLWKLQHVAVAFGTATLLVVATVASWLLQEPARAAGNIRSIGVLPLKNVSGDPAQEYLSDGMTDALIADLAQIGTVRVVSRTSVMRFKEARMPLAQLANELGVEGIVEGSVMRSGNRMRVTAQLIDAREDRHLWASNYEREVTDVLTLQAEVVRAITGEIKAQLAR
jgi:serine/threonine protein kinase/TolB-like protein